MFDVFLAMLSDLCGAVLYVLSVRPVCNVGVSNVANSWMDQDETCMQVGLCRGHILC